MWGRLDGRAAGPARQDSGGKGGDRGGPSRFPAGLMAPNSFMFAQTLAQLGEFAGYNEDNASHDDEVVVVDEGSSPASSNHSALPLRGPDPASGRLLGLDHKTSTPEPWRSL